MDKRKDIIIVKEFKKKLSTKIPLKKNNFIWK